MTFFSNFKIESEAGYLQGNIVQNFDQIRNFINFYQNEASLDVSLTLSQDLQN